MAGRFVLLEFDDSDSAESFCQNLILPDHLGYRVRGLFMRPDKFCECPDKTRQDARNWARGRRTGLFICVRCRKPSVYHERGLMARLSYVLGNNLLEER